MENSGAMDDFDLKFDLIQKSLVKDSKEVIEYLSKKGYRVQRGHIYSGEGDSDRFRRLITPKDHPDVYAVIAYGEDKVKFYDRNGKEVSPTPTGRGSTAREAWLDAARVDSL